MPNIEHTYGDRFAELLPKTVADIEKEIAILTNPITSGTIADQQKLSYLLDNEAELKRYINERYGITYSASTKGAYADSLDMNKTIFGEVGVPFGFRSDQLDVMSQLKRSNVLLYQLEASKSANLIFDSMISWAYTGSAESLAPFEALVGKMGASKYGSTIINTQISSFNRSVTAMAAEEAGVERFTYRGPQDSGVRPFCTPLVTKVFTIDEISQMSNGQTDDVMTTAGGYNCRHQWIPKVDTGE